MVSSEVVWYFSIMVDCGVLIWWWCDGVMTLDWRGGVVLMASWVVV